MQVTVISETIQEFDGIRYYLCGPYFQRKGRRLHRAIWESVNGPIPDGHHIHHVDHDASNNAIENLALMWGGAHMSHHNKGIPKPNWGNRVEAARKWHGSEEGRQWHREQFERHCRPAFERKVQKKCQVCGIEYLASYATRDRSKYCGGTCRARALRKRRAAESEA